MFRVCNKSLLLAAASTIGVLAATATSAKAALTLTLSEAGYTPTVISSFSDVVSYDGSYGDFTLSVDTGISVVSPGVAELQIQTLDVALGSSPAEPKTLTIDLIADGYDFAGTPGSTMELDSSLAGTITGEATGDTVDFQSFVPSITVPSEPTTALQNYTSPGNDSGPTELSVPDATTDFVRPADDFSLENTTDLSFSSGFEDANLSGTTLVEVASAVPEPHSLAVALLAGAALLRRRRKMQMC